jgi:transcriptional regulator with XRE-family HTH domain
MRGSRSQAEFAEFLGLSSQQTYRNYEAGRIPKPEILQQIAVKLHIDPTDLLSKDLSQEDPGSPSAIHDAPIQEADSRSALDWIVQHWTDEELRKKIDEAIDSGRSAIAKLLLEYWDERKSQSRAEVSSAAADADTYAPGQGAAKKSKGKPATRTEE